MGTVDSAYIFSDFALASSGSIYLEALAYLSFEILSQFRYSTSKHHLPFMILGSPSRSKAFYSRWPHT